MLVRKLGNDIPDQRFCNGLPEGKGDCWQRLGVIGVLIAVMDGRGGLVGGPRSAPGIPRSVVGPLGFACSRPFRCAKGAWVNRGCAYPDDLQTTNWIIDHGVELLSIVRIAKWMSGTVKGGCRVNEHALHI